ADRLLDCMSVETVRIAQIGDHADRDVAVQGWLYNKRSKGKLHFLMLRDGSGTIQAVMFAGDVTPEAFALADRIGQESSLRVVGHVRADARAPGGYELSVQDLALIQESHEYPITPKEHGVDFLMNNRHLW